jgi:hypothetical protein
MASNLRVREVRLLDKMLDLGADSTSGFSSTQDDFSDQWKLLIYDNDCRDIISPLLNVGALRAKGVTLHMLLHSEREAVPDAPAVYFVRPTEANLARIVDDCKKQLYRAVYLNFSTRVERPLLEKFAKDLLAGGCVGTVVRVVDQYLDVIALEPNLFTLNIPRSFEALNAKGTTELQMRSYIGRVAHGLLSTVRLLGQLPVIRAPPGGAAEMLAGELGSLLRENLAPRGPAYALFSESLAASQHQARPLLLIFDRSADMAPVLQHTSTYQSLVDDLLEYRLNRVTVEVGGSKSGGGVGGADAGKKKTYDLNTQADAFFSLYAGEPFPEAVEANERELAEVSVREGEIRSHPSGGPGAAVAAKGIAAAASTLPDIRGTDLSAAIESLPEILAKKANLEAHTNILQAVMTRIAAREVPTFFEHEQAILAAGAVADRARLVELLRDGTKGNLGDKARLLLIVALVGETDASKATWDAYETAFVQGCAVMPVPPQKADIDRMLGAVAFARKLQNLQSPMGGKASGGGAYAGSSGTALSSLLSAAGQGATRLMSKATSFFTKFTPLHVSRVVDNLSEGRACVEADTYCTVDPRAKVTDLVDSRGLKYSEVIVFVVGGGCYAEFYNLQELRKLSTQAGNTLRQVLYGSTELLSADAFIEQLQALCDLDKDQRT